MPIEFRCTQCDKLLRTGDDTAGKQAKCPECGTVMPVPVPDQGPVSPSQPMGSFEAAASPFGAAPAQTPPDSMNPYQSPAGIGLESTAFAPAGEIRPTQIDFSETLSRNWAVFKDRWLPVLGGFMLVTVISMAANFTVQGIIGVLSAAGQGPAIILSVNIIIQLIYNVFAIWLGIGLQMFMLGVVRGEEPRFGLLFDGGQFLLPVILLSILTAIVVFLGFLMFIIPGVIFLLMLWQAQLLVIDRNMGVLDAMSLSREVMVGNKLTVFLIYLVVMIVGFFAIILTCGIGYFGFLPYVMILNIIVYFGVTGQPTMAGRYMMPPEQAGGTPFGQPTPGTPQDDSPFVS